MQIDVRFRPHRQDDRAVELPDGATVGDLLAAVDEHAHVTVAVRAGRPIPEGASLQDGDEVLLLSAASGG